MDADFARDRSVRHPDALDSSPIRFPIVNGEIL
jgi:hypothetical protein